MYNTSKILERNDVYLKISFQEIFDNDVIGDTKQSEMWVSQKTYNYLKSLSNSDLNNIVGKYLIDFAYSNEDRNLTNVKIDKLYSLKEFVDYCLKNKENKC